MKRKIVLYCPDRHILYHGRTPDERGVGGGITSRVRLAAALAENGHDVSVVCNCPVEERIDGVQYIPLDTTGNLSGDVLIGNTSGGAYDLSSINHYGVDVRCRVLWVSGVSKPNGIESFQPDLICVKSNFLRRAVRNQWDLHDTPLYVIYNGYPEKSFSEGASLPEKVPNRLIYASHPDKGLRQALDIIAELRAGNPKFSLHVVGSEALWGQPETVTRNTDGVTYHGMMSNHQVIQQLKKSEYSVCLQSIEEGFGLTLLESLRAGCVVLASNVGAYSELISHGQNGFLIDEPHDSEEAIRVAVELISNISHRKEGRQRLQLNATKVPWDWDLIARAWSQVISQSLDRAGHSEPTQSEEKRCIECGGSYVKFVDGFRCLQCGAYAYFEHMQHEV